MSLKWLANNVSKWGGTYGFPYIFFEGPAEGYVNTKNGSVRAYTREEWQAAREHLADEGNSVTWSGRISLAGNHELADERMDAIAQNVAWAEDERRMNAMNSTYNHWQHLTDDITAYDPPGPTNIPECTFTTPDEDEAWRESEKRINPVWQSPHDAGGVCITHGVRYAAHEQCPMCVLASETTKEKSKAFENPEVKAAYDKQYSQYFRDVSYLDHIDVYRVHELFNVIDHALCHASKKLLTAGMRTGNKSEEHDVREARDTLNRWLEMRGE